MEHSLANHFCKYKYCKVGVNIFDENNIEKDIKDNSNLKLKEICLKRC